MNLSLDRRLFNPLYWHLRQYMHDHKIRYILIYGGSSAAKSYTVSQCVIQDSLEEKDRYMILRKFGSDLEESIYADFTGIVATWRLGKFFRIIKNRIHCLITGGYIRFRGLDDSEKIKGISRFRRVVMEEMTQFSHEDFKQIRKRLRGKPGQQILGMWNPVSEEHWIKTEVIDHQTWTDLPLEIEGQANSRLSPESFVRINQEGNMILIKTTYLDNFWIVGHPTRDNVGFRDEHIIADFEADKKHDLPYYMVYALGEWGKLDTGAEFYKSFSPTRNTGATAYDPEQPLHLSFDENVNPYLALSIYQGNNNHVWQIDEICLPSPRNTLEHTCTEFIKRYNDHQAGVMIYGDATSRKADVKLQKGYNFFILVAKYLAQYHPHIKVPLSNPPVMMRGIFANQIFEGRIPDTQVTIGTNCRKTINDLRYTKEAADGTKLKETEKDPKTGVTFQPYGHLSDTFDYFICKFWASKFAEFQNKTATKKRIALKPSAPTKH
jgi:phage terminase large subunit